MDEPRRKYKAHFRIVRSNVFEHMCSQQMFYITPYAEMAGCSSVTLQFCFGSLSLLASKNRLRYRPIEDATLDQLSDRPKDYKTMLDSFSRSVEYHMVM